MKRKKIKYGKYVPDDILFQILYKLSFRFTSKSDIVCSSIPYVPLFAFTLSKAIFTACFEILNGFVSSISSSFFKLTYLFKLDNLPPFAPFPLQKLHNYYGFFCPYDYIGTLILQFLCLIYSLNISP